MTYLEYKDLVISDLSRYVNTDIRRRFLLLKHFIKTIIRFDTFALIFWYRTILFTQNKPSLKLVNLIAKIRFYYNRRNTGIQIPLTAKLGKGLLFCHFSDIVFAYNVEIGDFCSIHQGVTIGRIFTGNKKGVPSIGNNVIIFPGSKVLGKIKIGNNVIIGANSTVLNDVPDNCIVVGSPAKIISKNSRKAIDEEWLDFFKW